MNGKISFEPFDTVNDPRKPATSPPIGGVGSSASTQICREAAHDWTALNRSSIIQEVHHRGSREMVVRQDALAWVQNVCERSKRLLKHRFTKQYI